MIAEEKTNKETITVLTTGPTIDPITDQDLTMVLNKEMIVRTTDRTIDLITDQDQTMVQDLTTDQDLIMDPLTDRATDHRIQAQIN